MAKTLLIRLLSRIRSGLALVAVLWVLLLLSVMAAAFLAQTRGSIRLADAVAREAEAEAMADAGFTLAVEALLDARRQTRAQADGTPFDVALSGGGLRIAIADEGGKIDLNLADHELLQSLMVAQGIKSEDADALADAIEDSRDADSLRRLHGAEDDDYRATDWPGGAKDAPFELVDELRQVKGMTQPLFERVAPLLTVHSGRATVNPRAASKAVLLALPGAIPAEIEAYIAARGNLAVGIALPRITGRAAQFLFATSSQAYSIRVEARPTNGGLYVRSATVRIDPARATPAEMPFKVLVWARGDAPASP